MSGRAVVRMSVQRRTRREIFRCFARSEVLEKECFSYLGVEVGLRIQPSPRRLAAAIRRRNSPKTRRVGKCACFSDQALVSLRH